MKPLRFLGSSRRALASFPPDARNQAGYQLFMVQQGREPRDFKPMPAVGAGACEIRVKDASGEYRVLYVAKFEEVVFVLHAFHKRTRKTSPLDLELATVRYRAMGRRR